MTHYNRHQMKRHNIYIYPLTGKVVFPYHEYRFGLSSKNFNADKHDNFIGFVTKLQQGRDHRGIQKIDGLSRYGTLLKIQKSDIVAGYSVYEGTKEYTINYLGLTFARFKIISLKVQDEQLMASVELFNDEITKQIQNSLEKKNLISNLKKELKVFYECKLRQNEADFYKQKLDSQNSFNKILFKAIDNLDISYIEKLKFLQLNKHEQRAEYLISHLSSKTENIKGVVNLEQKVRQDMQKSVAKKRSSFSLGERDGGSLGNSELSDKLKSKKLPEHVRAAIDKEMKNMGGSSQKAVAMKYIETLLAIPWLEETPQVKDMAVAEKILQEDHTGMKNVKERILQFLAVKFRNGNSKGNIICLHGPPGVGKTSIAKSIARALGKGFTRVSLGGMNDEAELRGHRRTYVGAMPGAIIKALMKVNSNNPVILLDQIEKLGKSYKGDPENALLQILDPSQNTSFVDHYVEIPVDLSKVMFICTANSLELSGPLLNRLQLIEVPGYSREEKLQIAKNHLLPIQLKENGVEDLVTFKDEALKEVIKYSIEMGVRQLQRKIGKICRKVARKGEKTIIDLNKVSEYLGKRHKNELWSGIGVVNGMAWTQLGGKVLTVEAVQYRSSKQKIQVTGQLGDVMKESVHIAFSWIKANIDELSILGPYNNQLTNTEKSKFLEQISMHIHFPEGATKKDGPSAGVTIATCLTSLLLKIPARANLSMTGQITLSGKVLQVGGVRQKCLAAIYEGIKHIIIPYANLKDIEKIDADLRKDVTFYPVKQIRQALAAAFPGIIENNTPKL